MPLHLILPQPIRLQLLNGTVQLPFSKLLWKEKVPYLRLRQLVRKRTLCRGWRFRIRELFFQLCAWRAGQPAIGAGCA